MIKTENRILNMCLKFAGINGDAAMPEEVIIGFSKVLLMEETFLRDLLSEEELKGLEAVRATVAEYKLDLRLIKSGLFLLARFPFTNKDEVKSKYGAYLAGIKETDSISEIFNTTLSMTIVPVKELFTEGKTIADGFAYLEKLKKETKPADENEPAPEGKQEEAEEKAEPADKGEDTAADNSPAEDEAARKKKKDEALLSELHDRLAGITSPHNTAEALDSEKEDKEEVVSAEIEERDIEELSKKYRDLSIALSDVVKGQDHALKKFIEGCFQGDLLKQTERGNHPRSYFFFFGPPGTGKTLLAETAAEAMGIPHKKFDMSDYSTNLSYEELIGTSQNYKNTRDGELVKYVAENPECLLIFDEIEKADISVIRLFLTILGSGYLKSKHTEKNVSFKDTIIIFTSNVGKELYADRSVNLSTLPSRVLLDAIRREKNSLGQQALPNEICSRIAAGNTILFNHLSIRNLAEMVTDNFDKIVSSMAQEYGCTISYSTKLPLLFLYNRGSDIDARVASGQSGNFLKGEIYELLRQLENRKTGGKIKSIDFDIDWSGMSDELRSLFVNEKKTEVLILSERKVSAFFVGDESKYKIHQASSIEKARSLMKYDITAVFIDPFFGKKGKNENTLSIADYNTDGVKFFHELVEANSGLPIYLIDVEPPFTDVDRKTFMQEGAFGTIELAWDHKESVLRQFEQIMDELYMEKQSQIFSQRGWVVDFKTKQDVVNNGKINIIFYDLKKKMAVDLESRDTLLSDAQRPSIKFDDVIGAESAKEELKYFIKYLKNPKEFLINGSKPPKGVLLYGPPGTGKTMLAEAMAGEADVHFIKAAASDFASKWVGESEGNIRSIFKKAKTYAPAIIFIDEIDAIGKQRTGADPHREAMLNTLLTEMQGFDSSDQSKPVFVLAATNYGARSGEGIGALDEALVRRFDNKIKVDLPNEKERALYITKQVEKKKGEVSEEVILNVAQRSPGKSLAILQNVIDLAFRNANKAGRKLEDDDLLKALEDYEYGDLKEYNEEYYRSVAIHETGHAYMSYLSGDEPSYITIEARDDHGGYMQHANTEKKLTSTKDELIARIRTCLAGRAAEMVFYGPDKAINTGASGDLQNATNIAFHLLCTYAMLEDQFVVLSREEVLKSTMASDYINRINELLKTEMKNTMSIIEAGRETIQAIADELVKENHLTGAQFKALMEEKHS